MKLTQKFIKEVSETIYCKGISFPPTEFFNQVGGTNFESQLSSQDKNLLEIGAPVKIEKFILLIPNLGWVTAYLPKSANQ